MALFTESAVRQRAQAEVCKTGMVKKAAQLMVESSATYTPSKTYDIFLSLGIRDADLIFGMKGIFEDLEYSVYVDWIEDPQLDRTKVTSATAEKLRQRMNSSKLLFFVTTSNAESSRWMAWECGFFDEKKEKVAIVPIQATSTNNSYSGQEYLGLYPYVVQQQSNTQKEMLWVRENNATYVACDTWASKNNSQITWNEG